MPVFLIFERKPPTKTGPVNLQLELVRFLGVPNCNILLNTKVVSIRPEKHWWHCLQVNWSVETMQLRVRDTQRDASCQSHLSFLPQSIHRDLSRICQKWRESGAPGRRWVRPASHVFLFTGDLREEPSFDELHLRRLHVDPACAQNSVKSPEGEVRSVTL